MHFSVPDLSTGLFWAALWKIIVANVILSGDNAVVIALASHGLQEKLRRPAILFGSLGAIVMLVIFCGIVNFLLTIPYLKLVGGALLLWIGVKLLSEEEEQAEGKIKAHGTLLAAIGTIMVANTVMSLDNAIAMAAAAHGDMTMIAIGLVISVPVIMLGATIIASVLDRYPWIAMVGAGLIGWAASTRPTPGAIWSRRSCPARPRHGSMRRFPTPRLPARRSAPDWCWWSAFTCRGEPRRRLHSLCHPER